MATTSAGTVLTFPLYLIKATGKLETDVKELK
jgi:hypothetical protein